MHNSLTKMLKKTSLIWLGISLVLFIIFMHWYKQRPTAPINWPLPVSVISAALSHDPIDVITLAQLRGPKIVNLQAQVSAPLLHQYFSDGAIVEKNDLMYLLDPITYQYDKDQAVAALDQAQAQLQLAEKELNRQKSLLKTQATSQDNFDQAYNQELSARAAVKLADSKLSSANLNLDYTTLKAPITGLSSQALVSVGNLVSGGPGGTPLGTITQTDPIWAEFSLSPQDLDRFDGHMLKAQSIESIALTQQDGSLTLDKGQLVYLSGQLDTNVGALTLRASFPNKDHKVLPGQFALIHMKVKRQKPVYKIPKQAVQFGPDGYFVYMKQSDDTLASKPVKTLEWSGSDWLITEGLTTGDLIVIDNLIKLKPGIKVKAHLVAS